MEKILRLKVSKVTRETTDAVNIHFKQPLLAKKITYLPGQFLTLLVHVNGRVERRCYSLNSSPKTDSTLSITVKRIKDGLVSNHLFETVKAGDRMQVLQPMGSFTLHPDKNKKRHIVLFGAGSGITPLFSILKSVIFNEPQSAVSLIYGNRDKDSIIFNEQLNELKSRNPDRLNMIHILEEAGDFEDCYKGRVERSQVKDILSTLPIFKAEDTLYYICGPSGMMKEAEEGLKLSGIAEERIHIERFSAPPPTATEVKAKGPFLENREIRIRLRGNEHTVPVSANQSILDAALDQKIKIPYVCMDGICGSCQAKCISGEVFMREGHVLPKKDREAGHILTCISKPLSNNVVIEYST